jgi:hypothetical protein
MERHRQAVFVTRRCSRWRSGVVVRAVRSARRVRAVAADDSVGWQPAVVYEYTLHGEEPSLTDRSAARTGVERPG